METLIFIAIAAIITIIQKKAEKAREQQNKLPPRQQSRDESADESRQESQEHHPPRSLQDLIRQFENAQRQASQGNIEPPTPPVEHRRAAEQLTLRDIAEVVIEVDFINLEFLMEEFDVDENTAAEMLMALQDHRIVGHDMGEGDCDVLVHDLEELDNLLSHEKRPSKKTAQESSREADDIRQRELERQRELNALEERAKSARESAAALANMDFATAETSAPVRKPAVSTKDIADIRKGFIWAKVLDEPRFKKRWSAQYR